MDHHQVCHGSFEAIPILDPVDLEKVYSYSASCHHCLQWHVQSHGWRYSSFRSEEDTMEGRFIRRHKGCPPEPVHILCWSHSNHQSAAHIGAYPWSFPEVAIIQEVGYGNGYESWGRDVSYYPIPGRIFEVCGEWILHQTSTNVHH